VSGTQQNWSIGWGPFGRFEASVRAEADALSGGFVQRFD